MKVIAYLVGVGLTFYLLHLQHEYLSPQVNDLIGSAVLMGLTAYVGYRVGVAKTRAH